MDVIAHDKSLPTVFNNGIRMTEAQEPNGNLRAPEQVNLKAGEKA